MKFAIVGILLSVTALVSGQEVRRALPAASAAEDDLAKFLAGVPLPETSPLAPLQKDNEYAAHVSHLARLSRHFDANYFSRMRDWSASELAPRIAMQAPVYYFFGGPDAVSALALYPSAPIYILGGLEPVGSIAAPLTLTPEALHEGLANLRKSTEVILSYGHFITKDMKAELDRTAFRGVLPLVYMFLAFTGAEVVSTSYVGVRADGSMEEFGTSYSGGPGVLPGAKIVFRASPEAALQTLYYVQANVADDALKSRGALLGWAGSFGRGNVYLKAASYLLHETYFSRIRDFLLSQSSVLQDDSGIPFRYFRDGGWRCWFFGNYSGTLEIFSKHHQKDLQEAFATPGMAGPLPFGTGYKWRPGESNLLLAVRQEPPRAEPVFTP
jgi:hypothetical protein